MRPHLPLPLLLLSMTLALPRAADARDRTFFQASRALAMGDAYTAYDLGYEAVYYNPAGVARKSKAQLKYFDLEGVASTGVFTTFKNSFTTFQNLSKIASNVKGEPGKVQAMGMNFLPQFLIRNFSVGLLARGFYEAYTDTGTGDMHLYTFTDLALYTHFGTAMFGGILKLGVGLKAINRAEVNKTYPAAEVAAGGLKYASEWQEGTGYGYDLGMLLAIPTSMQPTIGIALQDVGNTRLLERRLIWTSGGTPGTPPDLKQRLNVGLSFNNKHDKGIKSGISFEMKDVLAKSSDKDYTSRLHAGLEVVFNNILYLRGGLNQGRYWTAGIGLSAAGAGLELATYGENVAIGSGSTTVSDRKWVGRYVMGF